MIHFSHIAKGAWGLVSPQPWLGMISQSQRGFCLTPYPAGGLAGV